ncbi:testicular acid phosphatase homolog [Coccinella septempunctata]|uniref:testicular acid phosphatase homolog n=1 Tax=Coccinella septempunctata TaxID=41139 RepID=UPI001D06E14E|nr:testicular acid phosphatase homolog [Coccinella septempunctata]XP_044755301.1 testicular acid phosphatase homolog [Coccinella septempunctata]
MIILRDFLIISNAFFFCVAEDQLVAVTALIRHGLRIPENFYPNDPYSNVSWPFVLGDLTNDGVAEMYDTGKWLRKKYTPFLSEKYDPNQIYAQSLDYDRCIMTGEATLAGLYPPISDEIWNPNIRWQPTPIHISPVNQDIVVNMNACPTRLNESAIIRQTKTFKQINETYAGLFNYISNKSGSPIDFASMYPLFDTLYSELKLNLTLPMWAQKVWTRLVPLVIQYTKMVSLTPTERRLQVGPLLTRIMNQFESAISGKDFGTNKTIYRKYMSYFNTEWVLYDLTYSLGLPSIYIPDFGALYLLELRKTPEGKHYVNIIYRSSAKKGTKAKRVAIKGEKTNLSFERFKEITRPYMINGKEWKDLCEKLSGQQIRIATNVPMS